MIDEKYPRPLAPALLRGGRGGFGGILICRNSDARRLNVLNMLLSLKKARGGWRGRGWVVDVVLVREYRIAADSDWSSVDDVQYSNVVIQEASTHQF